MPTNSTAGEADSGWVLCLEASASRALLSLRLESGIEVGTEGTTLWVRGLSAGEQLRRRLDALPASARFVWSPPDRLCPIGSRIPSGRLPEVRWQPIQSWGTVTLDPGRLPGRVPPRMGLRLLAGGVEREAELLQTDLPTLQSYLRDAARIRWARLGFAASVDGRVLVRGTPLPAVPGARWVRSGRVYVPLGHHWSPAVEPAVVEELLTVAANEWVVWLPPLPGGDERDGGVLRLMEEQFLPLTPSALRATHREVAS